ncbi:MBL fold metallo-hydrolase [Allobranchiibius sp. CTAmp26]|uniref:MBL fold metallo-hydrolase n=1 Tax=Allobranchiibius sp. CTAmp26 TaxID=2815214 RepID=UPI001AA188F2|nr:MBL fold metallo-hydrolase [Allobranchiibius sp. CTAmp26]MBO1756902.1 MBL fold metallo-hydrolase [Allobranchiibius sp. CTAmp26]
MSIIVEPSMHFLLRANIWHLRGRDRDLIVDTGLGVASLRTHLPTLFERDPLVVITHAHLDHSGGAHEFDQCHAHPLEHITNPVGGNTLRGRELADQLGLNSAQPVPEWMIKALPHPGYRPQDYTLRPARASRSLTDGQTIDLGDRELTVLHLPGHSPGSIALYDQSNRSLFSGDVIYDLDTDEQLLDDLHGSNIDDYIASMRRLQDLDIDCVYSGHGPVLQRDRCAEIIGTYLRDRTHR